MQLKELLTSESQLSINPVAVEKLTHPKMPEKTLR
jgi:hypothetical protein